MHMDDLELEKAVYTRLRSVPGVASCHDINDNGIQLGH